MRFAERVEAGWAAMSTAMLVVVTLLCALVADGIRKEQQLQRVNARLDAELCNLRRELDRKAPFIKVMRVPPQCVANPLAKGCS